MNVSDATPPGGSLGTMAYNYAIVGVQKGGTSTLAVTLNQHRLVCQPPDKERHYFDDEDVDWSAPDHARDYSAPRRAPIHRLVGDASPTYLYWPHALERMHAYDSGIRAMKGRKIIAARLTAPVSRKKPS